jgi:hypothetical protein
LFTRYTTVLLLLFPFGAFAAGQTATKERTFYRDGGWSGEIKALKWGKLDTEHAWAIGRHSKVTSEVACSGREGSDRLRCARELMREAEVRIFADCTKGVAWNGDQSRYRLTDAAKAGKLRPLEDESAWTGETTHRGRWTVASWLGFLCPASSKTWRLDEAG